MLTLSRIVSDGYDGQARSLIFYRTHGAARPRSPASQQLMLVLTGAGPLGITHADPAAILNLDTKVLDNLLDALIRGGEVERP